MANILTGVNPLYLDTAGASSERTDGLWITSIVWDGGPSGVAGDVVILRDANGGTIIFQAGLSVDKEVISWSPAERFYTKGLYLSQRDNGVILIYTA